MGCCSSKKDTTLKKMKVSNEDMSKAWEDMKERLPRGRNAQDKQRRIALFSEFDKSVNGRLSLEEAYWGCVNVLHLDELTPHLRDIVRRAFNKAKEMGTIEMNFGSSEFVEFLEFRLMLVYIYYFFEITVLFNEIDTSGNLLIDRDEFNAAIPRLRKWNMPIRDPDSTFNEIDANGSGSISFDEFAAWAAAKKLDTDVGTMSDNVDPLDTLVR